MERQIIAVRDLALQPFTAFGAGGALLVSGTSVTEANVMTVSWGSFGVMWGKPVVTVMVRPTRYTYELIVRSPGFTLNWLPGARAEALRLCGRLSGRQGSKFVAVGLQPEPGVTGAPVVAEAELVLECRTLYSSDLDPGAFADRDLEQHYPARDYHRLFTGEVVAAAGTARYRRSAGDQ